MTGRHQRPRGILFDIGDTLLYQESLDPALGLDRLLQLATNSGVIDAAGFHDAGKRLFHDVVSWRNEIRECGLNHIELRFQSFLRLLLERFGLAMERDDSDLELEFWNAACPMLPEPGVHAVLEHLSDCGIPAGVVSNTVFSSRTIEWELARHGLTEHLSFVMASADYGVRKPHADLFLTAVRKLGLSPSEVWYVGNSLEADIAGAGEAGLVPVWYTRRVREPSHHDGLSFDHWDAFVGLLKASS